MFYCDKLISIQLTLGKLLLHRLVINLLLYQLDTVITDYFYAENRKRDIGNYN